MALWPSSVATDADLYVAVNSLQTTLSTLLGTSDTSVVLASATGFPVAGAVTIGTEVIFYTNISGATLTGCTRGADGTTAAAHSVGVPVGAAVVAFHHNVLKNEIEAIETYLNTVLGKGTAVTSTEFGYLHNVTSAIQTQINAKATDTLVVHLAGAETITGVKVISPVTGTMLAIGSAVNLNPVAGEAAHIFEVTNDASAYQVLRFTTYGLVASLFGENNVHWCRMGGTSSSPTATVSGDTFMSMGFRGHDGTNPTGSQAAFSVSATQNWTGSNRGIKMVHQVTLDNTTARIDALIVSGAGTGSVTTYLPTAIKGTTTNDNATALYVGEYVESIITSANFPATGTWGDAGSISLTAGDWDVTALGETTFVAITITQLLMGITTTSGNSGTGIVLGSNACTIAPNPTSTLDGYACLPAVRLKLASTTTVYFKFKGTFSGTAPQLSGRISARRVR